MSSVTNQEQIPLIDLTTSDDETPTMLPTLEPSRASPLAIKLSSTPIPSTSSSTQVSPSPTSPSSSTLSRPSSTDSWMSDRPADNKQPATGKRRGLTVIISDCDAGGPRFKSRARNSFFSRNLKCLSSCCIRGCLNHTAIQKHLLYLLLSPGNIRGCLNHIAIKRRWISSGVLRWQLPKNL